MIRDRKEDKMASTKASHGGFFIKNGQRAAKVQALPVFLDGRIEGRRENS